MVLEPGQIPYDVLTKDLLTSVTSQRVVPFLGAGASISARSAPERKADHQRAQDPRIAAALAALSRPGSEVPDDADKPRVTLDETSRLYAEVALEVAFLIQQIRELQRSDSAADVFNRMVNDTYPPSAGDLVEWLSKMASYSGFEDVVGRIAGKLHRGVDAPFRAHLVDLVSSAAGLAGVAPASLSALSSYFEGVSHRHNLLDGLRDILTNKAKPTPTHQLIARLAAEHLSESRARPADPKEAPGLRHYLIMTTNYDTLVEQALSETPAVPHVVLSMNTHNFQVRARFANMPDELKQAYEDANKPRPPRSFTLDPPRPGTVDPTLQTSVGPIAIVYKVHGCITDWAESRSEEARENDSIVISDDDYIKSIARFSDNDGFIPACASNILSAKRRPYFLFLGYSLRDWNIRGMLSAVRRKRSGAGNEDQKYGDYSVVRSYTPLELALFEKHHIRIIHEELTRFSSQIDSKLAKRHVS